jgi:hypothetical protein
MIGMGLLFLLLASSAAVRAQQKVLPAAKAMEAGACSLAEAHKRAADARAKGVKDTKAIKAEIYQYCASITDLKSCVSAVAIDRIAAGLGIDVLEKQCMH